MWLTKLRICSWLKRYKRIFCFFSRHKFKRYFTQYDKIELVCSRCEKQVSIKKDTKSLLDNFFD